MSKIKHILSVIHYIQYVGLCMCFQFTHFRSDDWENIYTLLITRAPSQYPKRRLFVRSRKVSKPRDLYLDLSDRSEIWQTLRQQCCRCACQISKRYDNLKYRSRGFETSRDLTKRRLFGYWDGALAPWVPRSSAATGIDYMTNKRLSLMKFTILPHFSITTPLNINRDSPVYS